jgi:hypothetical protein
VLYIILYGHRHLEASLMCQKEKEIKLQAPQRRNCVRCSICCEANDLSDFTSCKKWNECKFDSLKRYLMQKLHVDSVIKLQNLKKGGIILILTETQEHRKLRVEVTERKGLVPI